MPTDQLCGAALRDDPTAVDEGDLYKFFGMYDSNGSGTLDYKEFSDIVFGKAQLSSDGSGPSAPSTRFKGTVE